MTKSLCVFCTQDFYDFLCLPFYFILLRITVICLRFSLTCHHNISLTFSNCIYESRLVGLCTDISIFCFIFKIFDFTKFFTHNLVVALLPFRCIRKCAFAFDGGYSQYRPMLSLILFCSTPFLLPSTMRFGNT